MSTSVIDPAWLKVTPSTELAPVPDPIDTISDHLTKLLPVVFNAKRLLPNGDKHFPPAPGRGQGTRTTEIDGRTYAFNCDVDTWVEGLETFLAAVLDTLAQAGFAPTGAQTADVMKLRDAIGGIPANLKDARYDIFPEKLLAYLHADVQVMTDTHLGALHSVIGDVLKHANVDDDQQAYADHQYLTGEWSVPSDVIHGCVAESHDGGVMHRISEARQLGLNPCAFLTAAEVRAEDVDRERQGLGPLAES